MSYILDALKKLEKERKRGRIPGLSEQDSIVYHSRKTSPWPYILISVLFLSAGVLIAWFSLSPPKAPPGSKVFPDAAARAPKMPDQAPAGEIKSLPSAVTSSQLPAAGPAAVGTSDDRLSETKHNETSERAVREKDDPNNTSAAPAENRQKKSQETKTEGEIVQPEQRGETPPEPVVENKLYTFSELPPSVRESLKKFFTISAYMYSNTPSERMVRINNRTMREGQEMEPGIRIEEIVSDGVIFSYRKYRFFVSVK